MSRSSARTYNPNKIRPTKTYSIEELAEGCDKAPATIREWIREGLTTIDDLEPPLIHGWAFHAFMKAKWDGHKIPCLPNQFVCLSCRAGRDIEPRKIVSETHGKSGLRLKACCPTCGSRLTKTVKTTEVFSLLQGAGAFADKVARFNGDNTLSDNGPHALPNRRKPPQALPRNPQNERLKRRYFEYRLQSDGVSPKTLRKDEIAMLRFEALDGHASLLDFSKDRAIIFKTHLDALELTAHSRVAELRTIREFYLWVLKDLGPASGIRRIDIDYLKPSKRDIGASRSSSILAFPSIEEATRAFRLMPAGSVNELRNRAIFGLLLMTGIRVGALITLKIKHYHADRRLVYQDPNEVATKGSRAIDTFLVVLDDDVLKAFEDWIAKLVTDHGFGPDDPLFPTLRPSGGFGGLQLAPIPYSTAQAIQNMIRRTFAHVGLKPYTPHRFRNALVAAAYERGLAIAEMVALSRNLGHSRPMTTLASYGKLPLDEQGRLIREGFGGKSDKPVTRGYIEQIVKRITGLDSDEADENDGRLKSAKPLPPRARPSPLVGEGGRG